MAQVATAPAGSVSVSSTAGASYVEWGAVFAGAVLAAALSFVFLTFGAAIGLSAASPWPNSGASAKVIASLAVFWTLVQQIGAFLAGGYVAGRMRARWHETTQHEVEFRDGLHGGLVWAVGVMFGAALLMATAGGAARTGAEVAGKAAAATVATSEQMDLVLDTLFRPASVAQASPTGTQPTQAARARAGAVVPSDDVRGEVSRILARSVATGSLSDQNRTYLVQLVAQRAGISQPDAEKRVNEAFNAAREAANKARRAAILTGLVTAVSLIISFGAAWWAAMKGGHHRDNAVPARFDFGRRPRPSAPLT
jgi:hypothetical protein